jgi:hypothetical protein
MEWYMLTDFAILGNAKLQNENVQRENNNFGHTIFITPLDVHFQAKIHKFLIVLST